MLRSSMKHHKLFAILEPLVSGLGLRLVEAADSEQRGSWQVRIVIKAVDRYTTIDDCSRVHKAAEPRLSLMSGEKALQLEVSTPGIQRVFKDVYEFEVFSGERVRVYDERVHDWVAGYVAAVTADTLILTQHGTREEDEMITIPLGAVSKAKLDSVWEGK
jgi:ribosome maturation factor RimP